MTNGEKLKAMNPKDLSIVLYKMLMCSSDDFDCKDCPYWHADCSCPEGIQKWLEAEEKLL